MVPGGMRGLLLPAAAVASGGPVCARGRPPDGAGALLEARAGRLAPTLRATESARRGADEHV